MFSSFVLAMARDDRRFRRAVMEFLLVHSRSSYFPGQVVA